MKIEEKGKNQVYKYKIVYLVAFKGKVNKNCPIF